MSKKKLALEIIGDTFGATVKMVANGILDTEECTFRSLQRTLALTCSDDQRIPLKRVRQSLLILIKHHIVIVECTPDDTQNMPTLSSRLNLTGLLYRIDLDEVLRRLKFGQMLHYVSANNGSLAEAMLESIIVHGSLSFPQLQELTLTDARAVGCTARTVLDAFNRLVEERFIIGHPPLEIKTRTQAQAFQTVSAAARTVQSMLNQSFAPGTASSSAAAPAASGIKKPTAKRGRKAAGAGASSSPNEGDSATSMLPVELRALAEQQQKASAAAAAAVAVKHDEEEPVTKRRRLQRKTADPDPVASVESSQSYVSTSASSVSGTARWKIGVEQYLKIQKHQICREFIEEQFAGYAAQLVAVVMKESIQHEVDCKAQRSMTFSLLELQKWIKDAQHAAQTNNSSSSDRPPLAVNLPNDFSTLRELLEVMRLSSCKAVLKVGNASEQDRSDVHSRYVINYESLFTVLRRRTVHSIAIGRFGTQSARIVELLMRQSFLEQQAITDRVILPARETRERLYALFQDGWISYQELSRRGDFSASSSAFFWYVDQTKLTATVNAHIYHSLFNLLQRRTVEIAVLAQPILLSREDEILHRRQQQRIEVLNFAEQQLDRSLVVLEQTVVAPHGAS